GAVVELGGDEHLNVGVEVAAPLGAQVRHALADEVDLIGGLGAGRDVDDEVLALEVLEGDLCPQGGVDGRDADGDVQVVPLPVEHRVRTGGDLHVEVTGRATTVADLALPRHADAHAVADAGRDVDHQVTALLHATTTGAAGAGVLDDLAVAVT